MPSADAPSAADTPAGLSSAQASALLQRHGPNAVPEVATHPLRRVLGKFWAPVPWLLELAIALELVLGKRVEAAIIALLLAFNAWLGWRHEARAQATLAALQSRLALNATVLRDGRWTTLPATGLVPGDVVQLVLGAVVPADLELFAGEVLLDQSQLTGESEPVPAHAGNAAYAGALVRRGQAQARVTATGARTRFGRTTELVRGAGAVSTQQKAVLHVVRNLALVNGVVIALLLAYALWLHLAPGQILELVLTAVLAAIPVALPATFTLAAAIGARQLVRQGVLPTRLSAVDEAASIDVLCSDKTGTLTENRLSVSSVHPLEGFDATRVLMLARLASADAGQDPLEEAVRAAALPATSADPRRMAFVPFDPASKYARVEALGTDGGIMVVLKGAPDTLRALAAPCPQAVEVVQALQGQGQRVLAVACGVAGAPLRLAGFVALSDAPRPDSAALIAELRDLGVRTLMVTGDAPGTAVAVARKIGLPGALHPGPIGGRVSALAWDVYAGVLPEDKYQLVRGLQAHGRTVGMCGDGVNDAPALRQAQMGIAVATATDVAKSAAGMVLTTPGLGGIVAAIHIGRTAFQRILSYTLNMITKKTVQALFLAEGLVLAHEAILTPYLMVLIMLTGDLLGMALTGDTVRESRRPNAWQIDRITAAGVAVGLGELAYCTVLLLLGLQHWGLSGATLQSLGFILIVFGNQATCYLNRDRRSWWSSRPSGWLLASTIADLALAALLAGAGLGMAALPLDLIGAALLGALVFVLLFDPVKRWCFARLGVAD